MSMWLNQQHCLKIIDRSLPEIYKMKKHIRYADACDFCSMLMRFGVDAFELDVETLQKLPDLVDVAPIMIRVRDADDVAWCKNRNISSVFINITNISYNALLVIKACGMEAIVEMDAGSEEEILSLIHRHMDIVRLGQGLRINGLCKPVCNGGWVKDIRKLLGDSPSVTSGRWLDICPGDDLFMGTAIATDAAMEGADSITGTFAGFGCSKGFAALEEAIVALKILSASNGDAVVLSDLPLAAGLFEKMSGNAIGKHKAIIGSNIFDYESGIHADGISKNPSTYEPFQPEWVGRERRLVIGKHSGSRSVICKLKELGAHCTNEQAVRLLQQVRRLSADAGRSLNDEEMYELYCQMK